MEKIEDGRIVAEDANEVVSIDVGMGLSKRSRKLKRHAQHSLILKVSVLSTWDTAVRLVSLERHVGTERHNSTVPLAVT